MHAERAMAPPPVRRDLLERTPPTPWIVFGSYHGECCGQIHLVVWRVDADDPAAAVALAKAEILEGFGLAAETNGVDGLAFGEFDVASRADLERLLATPAARPARPRPAAP